MLKRTVGGFRANDCPLQAAGLTYFVVLAVVPVLCCVLVVAKACHVDRYAREQINVRLDAAIVRIEKGQDETLAQLTPQSEEARQKRRIAAEEFGSQARRLSNELFERIDRFDVSTLGWIGFSLLLWTVVSTLGTVENCFNRIWGVSVSRPLWKRATLYLFLMIVLPVFGAAVLSLPIFSLARRLVFTATFLVGSSALAFFFWLMPNCRVSPRAAAWGGALTGLLVCGWMELCAIAQVGIANSSALYGSFALVPIVLAWLYMSWQIVLLGCNFVHALDSGDEGMEAHA